MSFFDQCYQARANLINKPSDWKNFWYTEIQKVKSIPKSLIIKKKSTIKFKIKNQLTLQYNSVNNYRLSAQLFTSSSLRRKSPIVIIFPDYLEKFVISKNILNLGFLFCLVQIRGHNIPLTTLNQNGQVKERKSYGYFAENMESLYDYYMKQLLLDAYKTIEMLAEEPIVDTKRIGVWGRGIGATMALFTSKFSNHISSQLIESPSFCHTETLHKSHEHYAVEINTKLKRQSSSYQKKIKNNFKYFDGIFFAENLQVPSTFITNLNNKKKLPEQTFSIFHEIKSEKEIHIFTEDTPKLAEEQNKKIHNIAKNHFDQTL